MLDLKAETCLPERNKQAPDSDIMIEVMQWTIKADKGDFRGVVS
jgi:hypothetical protein